MSTYTDLDSLEICVQRAIDTKTRTNNPSDLDEVTKLVEDALTKEPASASVVEGRLETIKKMVCAIRKAGRIGLGEEFGVDDSPSISTISPTSQTWSVTPAAMAGVTRSVWWMRQKL